MILTIIIFILTLFVLVVIHELGHFLMAKKFNVKVEEFGFGIPPRAWGKKFGETLVSVNWLPFGGFVRLKGEDDSGPLNLKRDIGGPESSRDFRAKSVWQRMAIVIAGVVMNFLLASLFFYVVLGFQNFKSQFVYITPYNFFGVNQSIGTVVLIRDLTKDSPAQKSGIKVGERVLEIEGSLIKNSQDITDKTRQLAGKEIELTLSDEQGQAKRTVKIIPRKNPPEGQGPLGIVLFAPSVVNLSYDGFGQRFFSGPVHALNLSLYSIKGMGTLISRSFTEKNPQIISSSVAGPVGITSMANTILTSTKNPIIPYLDFMALISLNLAVLNLIPFPALDGGRLFFLIFEAITRRKVHANFEKWVHAIGLALLLSLSLLITISDIRKIIF